jgi:hypothetical protein
MSVNPEIRKWQQLAQIAQKTHIDRVIVKSLMNGVRRDAMMRYHDRLAAKRRGEFFHKPLNRAAMFGKRILRTKRAAVLT